MAVVSVESAKGCGSADNQSIGRCDGGCLLLPVVPLPVFSLIILLALLLPSPVAAQDAQCTDIVGDGVFDPIEQYVGGTLMVSETVTLVYDAYSLVVNPGSYIVDRGVRYILGDDEYAFQVCSGVPADVPWDELIFHAVVFFGILCSGFLAVLVVRR